MVMIFFRYVDKLSSETRNLILEQIYWNDFVVATVAAKFLVGYLEKADGNISETALLMRFIAIARVVCVLFSVFLLSEAECFYFQRITSIPLLIEAALPFFKTLHNFDLLVDVLLNHKEITCEQEIGLLLILIQSARQIITGKSEVARKNSRKGICNVTSHFKNHLNYN